MRKLHYSIHTERSYCDWVRRLVLFHRFQAREALLAAGSAEVEAFLSSLALEGNVAASTQNQALNALVFLYKHVLKKPTGIRRSETQVRHKISKVRSRNNVGITASSIGSLCFVDTWIAG